MLIANQNFNSVCTTKAINEFWLFLGFPEFTNCEDRKPARATCGANHQCMSQRCSPYTSGKKCARCQGSGGQDCGTACDDDDKCCSGSCTCGNDGNPGGSGTRCC